MVSLDALRAPFTIGSLTLANRMVMAPMTRSFAPHGVPTPGIAAYYRRRAEGRVGLILTEAAAVARPGAHNHHGIPFFHGAAPLAGWRHIREEVHAAGGRIGPQLYHVGRSPNWARPHIPCPNAESPSGLPAVGEAPSKRMSEEDIADTIAAFAAATSEAERAGFDVIELHGAHGYLTDQSFWGATNHRSDRFGGETLRLRTLFAVELLRAVRGTVSADFPVIVRVSQWKMQDYQARLGETPGALGEWLGSLVIAGSDMLHCSQRRFWGPEFPEIDGAAGLNLGGGQRRSLGPRRSPLAQLAWVTWRGQPHWPDWPGGWSMASSISRRLGGHS